MTGSVMYLRAPRTSGALEIRATLPGVWPRTTRRRDLPPKWFIRIAWAIHRAIYRVTGGRRGLWKPAPGKWGTFRLTTIGRKSGKEREAILGYYEDGPNLVTMAMNGWMAAEPAWWLNLQAQPEATVVLKGESRRVRGRAAVGEERTRLWQQWREIDEQARRLRQAAADRDRRRHPGADRRLTRGGSLPKVRPLTSWILPPAIATFRRRRAAARALLEIGARQRDGPPDDRGARRPRQTRATVADVAGEGRPPSMPCPTRSLVEALTSTRGVWLDRIPARCPNSVPGLVAVRVRRSKPPSRAPAR